MTLLSVCQDTADVIGLTRPAAIITGTDQLSRQMLGLAKKTLEELGLMDWPVLEVPYTFATVVDQAQYDLPADFGREIGDTAFDAGRYLSLRGSLTPRDWARQRNALPSQLGRFKFRIFGNPLKINITPTPATVENIVFEYQTTYRVKQVDNSFKTTFFADDDVALVPEDLLKKGLEWRQRRAKGMDYSEEFDDYEQSRTSRLAQALSMGSTPVAYRGLSDYNESFQDGYVPESGFGP